MTNLIEKIETDFYSIESDKTVLELKLIDPIFNVYKLTKFKFIEYSEVESIIITKLKDFILTNNACLLSDDREPHLKINLFLEKIGFKITKKKILYDKFLEKHNFNYEDIFEYKTISEIGEDKFIEIFDEVTKDDIEREGISASIYYQGIKDDANKTFNPNRWKIVIYNKDIIGVIMPQVFWDLPEEGSIFYIGLIPKYRKKGYGKILHAKGLELLKDEGVKRYIGSTLDNNLGMNKIFELNNCNKVMTRFFYKLDKNKL
ncbi:MAG: GNAT family N-acetyltransferase [Candidatus Sericytochromatia bacterium]